jgi:hypothetical protein
MKAKSGLIINPTIGAEKLAEEDGMVNVAMECSNEGQKTPDTAWFNMEMADEGDMCFVNVVLPNGWEEDKKQDKEERIEECFSTDEEYEVWLIREEEKWSLAQASCQQKLDASTWKTSTSCGRKERGDYCSGR